MISVLLRLPQIRGLGHMQHLLREMNPFELDDFNQVVHEEVSLFLGKGTVIADTVKGWKKT